MTDRIRGLAFVLVAALLLAAPLSLGTPSRATALDGIAIDDSRFEEFANDMRLFGFTEPIMRTLASKVRTYPEPGYFHPTGQPPGIRPSSIAIAWALTFEAQFTPDEVATLTQSGFPLACDATGNVCAGNRLNRPAATEYYVYVIHTATPVSPNANARIEYGAAAFVDPPPDGGEARPWVPKPTFPDDIFKGGNRAWVMRSSNGAPWAPFSLAYQGAFAGFEELPTDALFRMVLDNETLEVFIPSYESKGLQATRAFSFWSQNGSVAPADSAAVTAPSIHEPMTAIGDVPTVGTTEAPGESIVPESVAPGASRGPGESAGPSAGPGPSTGGGADPATLLIVGAGLLLLLAGGWLLFRRGAAKDPCPELYAAWMAAQAACDEARKRARAAHAEADRAKAAADAARDGAAKAKAAREALEKLLDALRAGPDHGKSWVEGEVKGKTLRLDEYDHMLREEAYSEANARYGSRLKAAGGNDAARWDAHKQWQDELNEIGEPDYIERLREKDSGKREERIKKVEEVLKDARDAEADAEKAAADATAAADRAAAAAKEADALEAEVCARAAAAENAYREKCEAGLPPPAPKPAEGPPRPEPPNEPEPDKPEGGGGGGAPPGGGGGGEEPPPKGTDCVDGTEEWRPYGPARVFLVPRQGKVRVVCDPPLYEVTDWLNSWANVDSHGKPSEETDFGGVPQLFFRRMDQAAIPPLFVKVTPGRDDKTLSVKVPLQEVTLRCERKWICRSGHWVETNQCQAAETHTEKDGVFSATGTSPGPSDFQRVVTQAQRALKAATDRDQERQQAKKDCEACK